MIKLNTFESTYWVAGYQCCIVIYTFISFGLILVSVFNQSILMDETIQFYSDWDNYLIEDIQIKQSCDDGFQSILNFTWPGTLQGCDCTQSNGTDKSAIAENCQPVEQLKRQQFSQLPFLHQTVVSGFQICAKLSSLTAMEAFSKQDNFQNYRKCGNVLNVPLTSQCPISNFDITTDGNGIEIGDSGHYYNYQRIELDQMPISLFTIGYNSICFSNTEISKFYYLDMVVIFLTVTISILFKNEIINTHKQI